VHDSHVVQAVTFVGKHWLRIKVSKDVKMMKSSSAGAAKSIVQSKCICLFD
jgi:hypothetical protein